MFNFLKIPVSFNLVLSLLFMGIAFIQNESPVSSQQLASIKSKASYDSTEALELISLHPLSESIQNDLLNIFEEPNKDDDHDSHGDHNKDDDHGDDHYRV